jgi:hypothetical protein
MAKSIHELVSERFGVRTFPLVNPEVSTAETTSAVVLKADPNRYAFILQNLSAADIHLRPFQGAVVGDALLITANGSFVATMETHFTLPSVEWHIIGPAGSQAIITLAVMGEPGGNDAL